MTLEEEIADAGWFTVSGIIINDPNGPKRWCDYFEAATPEIAEDMARAEVKAMQADGLHGVLLVANVFPGRPKPADSYACYADDPRRPRGYAPADGWTPPRGFEGTR